MENPKWVDPKRQLRILLLEDVENDAKLITQALEQSNFKFVAKRIETRQEFVEEVNSQPWDIILADYALPSFDADGALAVLSELGPGIPLIVVSGALGEEKAVECMKNGAYDYVPKSALQRLAPAVANAIARSETGRLSHRLTTALGSTTDLVAILEPDGKVDYINRGGRMLLGLHDDVDVGQINLLDFYPEPHRTEITREALPSCMRKGMWSGESKMTRTDGREVTVSQVIAAHKSVRAGIELVDFLSTIVRDVSGQKAIEQKIRNEERRFRELADLLPEAVFEIDAAGRIGFANQKALRTFGYDRKELGGGLNVDVLVAPKDRDDFLENFRQRIRKEKTSPSDFLARRKDGTTFPVRVYSSPILSESRTVGLREILIDMTSQLEAEERLREQAALIDIAPSAILLIDLEGRITFWSKGAETIYKWKVQDVVGKKVSWLFPEKMKAEIEAEMALVIAGGKWDGEVLRATKEGNEIIVESHWTLIRDNKGKPKSVLISNNNITEKALLQKQYLRSQRIESLGILSSGIAHDLNNVLSPIMLSVQFLKERMKDEKSLHILAKLQESTARGADMVKQIFSFTRGTAGEQVPISLREIVNEVGALLRQTTPGNIRITTSFPESLLNFRGDQGQIYQALMNLCENAVEAMPMGGELSITCSRGKVGKNLARMQVGAPAGEYILLEIGDTGIGIPANVLPKIFDPFFTTKETERKLGLGLSTAAIVVKNHGGFIDVQSKVGGGTTFSIYLPIVEEEPQAAGAKGQAQLPRGNGETILVVDDEMSVVEMTRNTLELYDYNPVTATDGARAVAMYNENREKIRAVILDLMMPVMDGRATLKALREINPALKAIIITGSTQAPEEKLMLDANAYLKKPYGTNVLLNVLSDVLKS